MAIIFCPVPKYFFILVTGLFIWGHFIDENFIDESFIDNNFIPTMHV